MTGSFRCFKAFDKAIASKRSAIKIKEKSSFISKIFLAIVLHIKKAIKLAQKIAPTDATVLLLGETGTGKEVFANAIHATSKRSKNPFVAINCSAFQENYWKVNCSVIKQGLTQAP